MHSNWRVAIMVLVAGATLVAPARGEFRLTSDDRVVLFGDTSLSDVRSMELFTQFVRTRYPDNRAMVCCLGEKRSTMADAGQRLEAEVLPLKPTEVVLCFGIDGPERKPFEQARFDAHMSGLAALVDRIKGEGIRVSLLTPSPSEDGRNRGLNRMKYDEIVGRYAEAIRQLGAEKKLEVIDWYAAVKGRIEKFSGKTRVGWTKHGLVPSGWSLAILTDVLLEHWQAEPLVYEVSLDWNEAAAASATHGTVKVTAVDADHLEVALTGVPVVVNMLGRGSMPEADWPMSKWFGYRLKIANVPASGVLISSDPKNAKPFLAQQLAAGADVSTVGPLVANEATYKLHDSVLRVCNQFTKYRLAADRKAPEPELEEGFRLLKEAETSMALAACKICSRTPARFDINLRIEVPKEMREPAGGSKTPATGSE